MSFSDEAYGGLIADLFGQYRFTAREETASWSEAAVDPEMLGRAFESLMASAERRRTGAFFTPFALVERVADAGLEEALANGSVDALERLTVLDPACGSGAFLVHALERIADALLVARERARAERRATRRAHAIDLRRRRESHRRLVVRAAALVVGGDRQRGDRPDRRLPPAQSRSQHPRRRRAVGTGVRR